MKNPTKADLDHGLELCLAGKKQAEVIKELGFSHSQFERHLFTFQLMIGAKPGGFWKQPATLTEKCAQILKAREAGESWGLISVRFQEPESRTRKAFKESGLRDVGLRIGKGGRHLGDDPRFYTGGDRAKLGSELTTAKPISEQIPNPDDPVIRVLPALAKGAPAPKKATRARKATKKQA